MAEITVLGPVAVIPGSGGPAAVLRPREKAMLAALLLFRGRPCSRLLLTRAVWGHRPPRDPPAALRTLAARLKPVLESAGGRLLSGPAGYTVWTASGTLDAERFSGALAAAADALGAGRLPRADEALAAALACWPAGKPAPAPDADLRAAPDLAAEAARLAERFTWAELARADIAIDLGRHRRALPGLHTAAVAAPGSERRWEQLILALGRAGREDEALAAYSRVRQTLLHDIGAPPGPLLQEAVDAVTAGKAGSIRLTDRYRSRRPLQGRDSSPGEVSIPAIARIIVSKR